MLEKLHKAVTKGDTLELALLLERIKHEKININIFRDMTPLMVAVQSNNITIVEMLLNAGCDPNVRRLWMPLSTAVIHEDMEIVELLLKHGADVYVKSTGGESALDVAQRNNCGAVGDLIRQHSHS